MKRSLGERLFLHVSKDGEHHRLAYGFQLVGRTISLRNGRLATEEGTLAGAHLDLASAVRNAVKLCGVPLDDALRAASSTPARFLGLEHERGALIAGARADLVALTNDLDVVACWAGGMEESEFRPPCL